MSLHQISIFKLLVLLQWFVDFELSYVDERLSHKKAEGNTDQLLVYFIHTIVNQNY